MHGSMLPAARPPFLDRQAWTSKSAASLLSGIALDPLRHATTEVAAPADLHLVMIDSRETGIKGPSLESLTTLSNGREQRPTIDKRPPV